MRVGECAEWSVFGIWMDIYRLKEAIAAGRVVTSRHSLNEAAADDLVLGEIYDSVVQSGEVIEDYPNAYPTPAYLVLGFNTMGDPLHSVWSYDQVRQTAKLITVYRPDPDRWINWRIRK
jgi:Domain of unknown function (DUF4258)